jgi:hypothetical protein
MVGDAGEHMALLTATMYGLPSQLLLVDWEIVQLPPLAEQSAANLNKICRQPRTELRL